MHKVQRQVHEFHQVYKVPVKFKPELPSKERLDLRLDLIEEELKELRDAFSSGDLVEATDAIGDLLVVVYGTAIEVGVDAEPLVDEIHRSNLSKLGDNGQPIYAPNGKVLKGPNFFRPDIKMVLRAQGWEG